MPRIAVDLFKLRTPYCGLGQYCTHLGRAYESIAPSDLELIYWLRLKDRASLGADRKSCWSANVLRKEKHFGLARPYIPLRFLRDGLDLWHATDQYYKHLPSDPNTPVLLTIHDLNFLREKHAYNVARGFVRMQEAIDRATAITTISNFVADEIREHLDLQGKSLRVVYNGAYRDDSPGIRPEFLPHGPFLFAIGTVLRKKNFHVLLPLVERFPEYRLVIAGPDHDAYAMQIRQEIRDRNLESRAFVTGPISDVHRQWLYANCEAFLFPSTTEGFGLPVIEAMNHGRPVFCSRRTSLPEVAGPDAFYWDAYDPDHITQVFEEGRQSAQNDPTLGERLKRHASQFNWTNTARQYLEIYRELTGVQVQPHRQAA